MTTQYDAGDVRIIDTGDIRVGVLEHRGDPRGIPASIERFIAWRKQNHLPPASSATFNILYNNQGAGVDAFRVDLCAQTDADVPGNAFGVVAKTIPGGRCAVLRHVGSDDDLAAIATYLYTVWLPQSGECLRDFPLYLQRVKFFPEVPASATIFDFYLPLAPAKKMAA